MTSIKNLSRRATTTIRGNQSQTLGAGLDGARMPTPALGPARAQFDRAVSDHLEKACSKRECAAKEKHIRFVVLASFKDRGAAAFWSTASKLSLQGEPHVCWKFCYTLHKLLRDGHPNVLVDSQTYAPKMLEFGKLWKEGHLRDGFGPPIRAYCKLVAQKIQFHRKYTSIPGNLQLSDTQVEQLTHDDPNSYFEICIDMLDYLEGIVEVAESAFNSLEGIRATSMSDKVQCRLSPLIVGIQESALLYDYLVKFMFRVHALADPDTLADHRSRFNKLFRRLLSFYHKSKGLQYFKNLVQIPTLPDEPPNFLVAAEAGRHRRLEVVVRGAADAEAEAVEDEPEDEDSELNLAIALSSAEAAAAAAVPQFAPPQPAFNPFEELIQVEAKPPPPQNAFNPDDKDMLIKRLLAEIERLKSELQRVISHAKQRIDKLVDEVEAQELEIEQLRSQLEVKQRELDALLKQRSQLAAESSEKLMGRIKQLETIVNSDQDKLKKLKDIYMALREEHAKLLRSNADLMRQSQLDSKTLEDKNLLISKYEMQLLQFQNEKNLLEEQRLQAEKEDGAERPNQLEDELENAKQQIEYLRARLQEMLAKQRSSLTGVQLEVSEKIIDACNQLILAIRELIEKSRLMQAEIANASGPGTSAQFYKKHHRWAEGLISAAKAVGWAANYLFDSANKVLSSQTEVGPDGKRKKPEFEKLVVCSTEINASTTQLVMASKVKADPSSKNLAALLEASSKVRYATANVIATTHACAELIEDVDMMDFTRLTLHQAKRLEMESQTKVLQLEDFLTRERKRLADLRRAHYQLAGESEGWEPQNESTSLDLPSIPQPTFAASTKIASGSSGTSQKQPPPPTMPKPNSGLLDSPSHNANRPLTQLPQSAEKHEKPAVPEKPDSLRMKARPFSTAGPAPSTAWAADTSSFDTTFGFAENDSSNPFNLGGSPSKTSPQGAAPPAATNSGSLLDF